MRRLLLTGVLVACMTQPVWAAPKNAFPESEVPTSTRCVTADGLSYESCGGTVDLSGANIAGSTQYDQGTASTTTDTMNMLGCVRVDTPAVASGVIDGDRARCIVDSTNRLWVHVGVVDGTISAIQSGTWNIGALTSITNPVAVTGTFWQATQPISGTVTANAGTGNFTVTQGTGSNLHVVCDSGCSSSSGFGDNSAFTFGTTPINPIGGVLDDTSTNTATENSAAVARITAQKALHMNLRNNSGTEIGTSGAPIRTDPTGSTTQPVSGTVSITANSSVNVAQMNGVTTSMGVGASGTGTQRVASLIHDGTDTAQVTATSGGSLQVECTAGCSGSGGTSSNYGSAFPSAGTAAGFTDGTNMVAGRVVTSAPSSGDAGLVVRPISPASSTVGSAVPSVGVQVTGTDGTNARAIKTDSSGELQVDVLTLPNVTIGAAIPAGNNNIGDVDVASLPALPAGSNTIGNVNPGTAANWGVYVEDAAETAGGNLSMSGSVRRDTAASSAGSSGDNATINTDANGLLWMRNADPCTALTKVFVPISQATSTQLLTGTASNRTYVCSLLVSQPSASTQTFSLVNGTGSVCATSTAAMIGATTAANGVQLPFSHGTGMASVAKSTVNADNVCLLQSSTDRIAGVLSYVVAP